MAGKTFDNRRTSSRTMHDPPLRGPYDDPQDPPRVEPIPPSPQEDPPGPVQPSPPADPLAVVRQVGFRAGEATRGRVTVIQQVYHHQPGMQPAVVEVKSARWLDSEEQAYDRNVSVGPDWSGIDSGWVPSPSMAVLYNREGVNLSAVPSAAELDALKAKVVEVGFAPGDTPPSAALLVPPGEAQVMAVADVRTLRVRCRSGSARCTLTLIPS